MPTSDSNDSMNDPEKDPLDQALHSIQSGEIPDGPSPELIAATHRGLWYPFRSAEVQDICRHMTPDETRELTAYSQRTGLMVGILGSLLFYPLFGYLAFYTPLYPPTLWSFFILMSIAIPVGLIVGRIGLAGVRKKSIARLCATEYAIKRGYRKETLPLYDLPFGRGDVLIIALMIVVTMALIGALAWNSSNVRPAEPPHAAIAVPT